ncbi:hypothetical protein D3C86_1585730 [compost metagenome]
MIVDGDKAIGLGANHHADVAWRQKRVDTVVRFVQQAAQGRDQRNMLTEKEKVCQILRFCLPQSDGRCGHGGFKSKAEKHHFSRWILCRQLQGIHRRIDDTHIRAARAGLHQ